MPLVTPKRIHHLARYSGVLGLLAFLGYRFTPYSDYFLSLVGPPIFVTYWLRVKGTVVTHFIPNEPLFNDYLFLLPLTVLYFGYIGFQLKNILNERGKFRSLLLLVFTVFLIYVHRAAFQELRLYTAS